MRKVIYWDFHGTLAENECMFSKALLKVLKMYEPESTVSIDDFRKHPLMGFPWQDHEKDYTHLTQADTWWKNVEYIFTGAYRIQKICEEKAAFYAEKVRYEIVKPDEFLLFGDTIETLDFFKSEGYDNIILSNHVPELPEIAEKLGLMPYIKGCISSANVGYEKPNTEIYKYALRKAGYPEISWMVGDSIIADVQGAENAGIKGVLVRSRKEDTVKYYSKDLRGLKEIIR